MSLFELLPAFIGYIMCGLAVIHALLDARENRIQRSLMLITLFAFGFMLEYMGVMSGNYVYAEEAVMILGHIPLSVTFAWVGIIYSAMLIGERLKLSLWQRILTTTLIALSLDWGMDPIAVENLECGLGRIQVTILAFQRLTLLAGFSFQSHI